MTVKTILDAALKLPEASRARLAGKLLDSLDDPVWEDAILAGAKVVERRLRDLRSGKMVAVREEDAHQRLFGSSIRGA